MNVLLVPAHPGFPGQIPQCRKTVVCVCVGDIAFMKHGELSLVVKCIKGSP